MSDNLSPLLTSLYLSICQTPGTNTIFVPFQVQRWVFPHDQVLGEGGGGCMILALFFERETQQASDFKIYVPQE